MTKKAFAAALTCCLLTLTAAAQSGERTFRDAVLKRQLYLRNFSADARVRGRWDSTGNGLVVDAPLVHTVAAFVANSVKVKGTKVEIKGQSQLVIRESARHFGLSPDKEDVAIDLDLKGADMDSVLPQLEKLLFYPNINNALAAIPLKYQDRLPMKADDTCCGPARPMPPLLRRCDCGDTSSSPCMADGKGALTQGAKPPRVTYHVEPEFSEKARQKKFSGDVQVGLDVDIAGHPVDIWIIRGAGMGLDAEAGEAVSQYRFEPATCRGNPVPANLYIDVNFQIF